jgi:prepilin-type N-terminal cleavage/methylation domain-containing protein
VKNNLFRDNQKGFTLIELMVVVVVLSLVILGLVTFFTGGARSWIAGQSQLKAQREARQAMDRMVKEIRVGKEIVAGSDTSVTVKIPVFDSDGLINGYNNINYELDGTTIQREDIPLIDNVLNESGEPIFTYYNNSGVEISPPDSTVSKLHINLKVDVDDDGRPDITLNSDIDLRNYGL